MPPKAPTHTEHNVYLTSSVTFDNKNDDFGRLQVYQAFSSLDEANDFCAAKADELALNLDIVAPEPTLKHYTNDGAFRMELPLKHRNRDVIVETLIMPLMGGIIKHDKPVSRKTPKSKRNTKSKPSQDSDDEDDQDVDMDIDTKTTKASSRKKAKGPKLDTGVTEADIAAAPSGARDCLRGSPYTVFGHHTYWSEQQFKVIVRTFGGIVNKTLPVYNNNPDHTLVLGSDVPSRLLGRIKQKEFKPVTPDYLLATITRISNLVDPSSSTRITSEEVAKLCKKVPGKPVTRVREIEETDSDVDVKDASDE
ncbi:hypothetical protein QM012_002454 [Aureobasidium pullulans]|uniref:BRCT domain-containing protein n=1 Tax=Aureobasidium pullulans TaxID=5580 RepID=A0ABR0TC31_AURPU